MEPRIARRALIVALISGALADVAFDRTPLGVNVPIAVIAIVVLVTWFSPDRRPADRLDWWLPAVAVTAAIGPALRTDPTVVFLDSWLIAGSITAWSLALGGTAVTRRAATAVALLGVRAALALAVTPAWLLARAGADGAFSRGTRQLGRATPIVRGGLLAVPVVIGFAVLLGSADAVFGRALDDALHVPLDLGEATRRTVFGLLAAAFVAGPSAIAASMSGLVGWAGFAPLDAETAPSPARGTGATETIVVLLAVDVLFAVFAAIQVVYLFGGRDTLAAVGMTYSDYARQGYFQLVAVVALAGLLVVGAHHVVGRTRSFLAAGAALLALTAVVLVSAAVRLGLYQGAYGWTELRFFVATSIAWLGACLVLAVLLLATDRMRWLPHSLALSAVAVTLAVSAIGPQAFVMHENLARVLDPALVAPGGEAGVDLAYGMTLGDDAIPDLVATLGVVPSSAGSTLLRQLRLRREELEESSATASPLSWNIARQRALEALRRLPAP